MATAILASKGQITIPVDVCNDLKWVAGDRVEFVQTTPERYEFIAATSELTKPNGCRQEQEDRLD